MHILLGFLACAAASLALGTAAVRVLRLPLNRLECLCLGYVLGSPLTSALTLALASLWVARKGVFLAIGVLSITLLWRQMPWFRTLKPAPLDSIPGFFKVLLAAAWIVYGLMYFRFALSPETSFDGMSYHLGLVNLWNHAHGLLRVNDMYAALPSGMEMLFLFAFAIGRHSAATLVHFSFLMLLPVLMVLYGVRFGLTRGAAPFAAIAVFVTPMVGWDGSVAYNDIALTAVGFAAVYFLRMWRGDKSASSLTAACLLAGFAAAIKYTGGFLFLFVIATVVWELRRESRAKLARTILAAAALGALIPAPYLVRNCIWFHNPIAPFGNAIFRNPYFHVSSEKAYIEGQAHLHGVTWSELPLELTIGGPKLQESLGAMYLLSPIALVGFLWPESRFLVLAALVWGLSYPMNKDPRFLMPILPFVLLAVGYVYGRARRAGVIALGALSLVQLIACWPAVTKQLLTPRGKDAARSSWKFALRRVSEDWYLRDRTGEYAIARLIESHVPEKQTVMALGGGVAQSYTIRPILDSYRSADAERAVVLFYGNAASPTNGGRRWTAAFPPLRAVQLQILQTGRSADAMWSIDEIRLWRGGDIIPPARSWRLDAFPNPWDIGFAFDGVIGTRWQSWEAMRPGMSVSIRFDAPLSMDRIEVVSIDPQWASQMSLRILTDAGGWLGPPGTWQPNPPMDTRKNATRELKREGVHYVVIVKNAYNSELFAKNPSAWGLTEVDSSKESTLYRID
jgi:hypothetical protein